MITLEEAIKFIDSLPDKIREKLSTTSEKLLMMSRTYYYSRNNGKDVVSLCLNIPYDYSLQKLIDVFIFS